MRIYAIGNQKGGVGKTADTINLGAALAELGRRVLLVDWDPQGHLTDAVGVKEAAGPANLAAALLGQWQGELGDIVAPVSDGLWVTPTSDEMFLLEPQMYGRAGREFMLSKFLDPLVDVFDDVLIDCPPSLGALNDAGLVAARRRAPAERIQGRVIIPVEAKDSSVRALRLFLRQMGTLEKALRDVTFDIAGLIVNLYDARKGKIATSCLAAFEAHPLDVLAVMKDLKEVTESWRVKTTVLAHAPDSEIAQGFRALAPKIDPSLAEAAERAAAERAVATA